MVEVRGESSNLNKAATAARAFARPIGGVSEANCREIWKMVVSAVSREPVSVPLSLFYSEFTGKIVISRGIQQILASK